MFKKLCSMALVLLSVLFCGGCNREKVPEQVQVSEVDSEAFSFDWGNQKMIMKEDIGEDNKLSVVEFKEWEHDISQDVDVMIQHIFDVRDGYFYDLQWFASEDVEISLYAFDVNGMEGTKTTVPIMNSTDLLAVEYITDMDITDEGQYTLQLLGFALKDSGQFIADTCRLLTLDMSGEKVTESDMFTFYEGKGLFDKKENIINPISDCIIDKAGNCYTRSDGVLYIADHKGQELMSAPYGEEGALQEPIHSDDGMLVFPKVNNEQGTVQLVWYDVDAKQECVLCEFSSLDYKKILAMRGYHIYYCLGEKLVKWNVISGEREVFLSLKDNGIHANQLEAMTFREDGTPVLRVVAQEEDMIMVLGERISDASDIRIVDISGGSYNLVQGCAADYSRRNPLCKVTYEKADKGQEDAYKTRVMAEIVGENCPDLLFVSCEDLNKLPKESLLDLRELISEDTLNALWPGTLELGTVDGRLLGIPTQVSSRTLVTYSDVWNEGNWDLQGMFECAREKEVKTILPAQGYAQAFYMLIYNPLSVPYIDWENGISKFESEEFVSLLTYLQEHQLDKYLVMGEDLESLKKRESLATIQYIMSFSNYESFAKRLGEDMNIVGFPTYEKHGSYLETDGVLAVSVNASDKEAIASFLEYILSEDGQQYVELCGVKRNAVNNEDVIYEEDGTAKIHEDGGVREIFLKKDGTTYIEDFNAYMEQCVAKPLADDKLRAILEEELDAFFAGGKSAEDVAKVIDNRVQLYLNERK